MRVYHYGFFFYVSNFILQLTENYGIAFGDVFLFPKEIPSFSIFNFKFSIAGGSPLNPNFTPRFLQRFYRSGYSSSMTVTKISLIRSVRPARYRAPKRDSTPVALA